MSNAEKDLCEIIIKFDNFERNMRANVGLAIHKHGLIKTSSVTLEIVKVRKALEALCKSM